MKRRQFITLIGGGIILAATGATVFVATRNPARATAPWSKAGQAGNDNDIRRFALSYAILAPNPHNRQPWKVDLSENGKAILFVDTDRMLPHTDPFNRQITIGLGCFIELMIMAAAARGYRVDLNLFPWGSAPDRLTNAPVAIATFTADASVAPDPLFRHALARRSNKEPFYTAKPVQQSAMDAMIAAGRHGTRIAGSNDMKQVQELRRLTSEALQIEIDTPHTYKESVDLFRIGKAEVEANPDGIHFTGALFESLALVGQFDRQLALDRNSTIFRQGKAAVLANAQTAMAHVWMVTDGNSRQDQIAAGRDWLRVNLAATAEGVGFQPLSQALQEYPEMAKLYSQVHERFAPSGGTVQMLSRLGYGPAVPPSPRWPLEAKLMEA
jgi:hypothetical protein